MNELTTHKCLECGAFLEYDIRSGEANVRIGEGPAAPNAIAPSKRFGISFDIEITISNVRIGE